MAEPWEMQKGETSKAFQAFCVYRDLGYERSIPKVCEALKKNKTTITDWCSKYEWVNRAAAWDEEQDRIVREKQIKDIVKMRQRHAKIASDMLEKAARALNSIPPEEIKPQDISRMVDVASKLERLSRGDTSEVVEERDGGKADNAVQIYIPDNNRGRDKETFDDIDV